MNIVGRLCHCQDGFKFLQDRQTCDPYLPLQPRDATPHKQFINSYQFYITQNYFKAQIHFHPALNRTQLQLLVDAI